MRGYTPAQVLIVAIHDVATTTLEDVRWLLGRLDAAGVQRRVLKVVPAPESEATDDTRAALRALLAAETAAGSELVLHGWTHHAAAPLRGSALDRARAGLFAGDGAEFMTLDAGEMRRRLALGRAWLAAGGLAADGFCPPGWLAAPGLPAAARAEGFGYLLWLRGIRDLRRRRWISLPPIGYMGAGPTQEALVRLGAALLARPLTAMLPAPAHRVFLHPQGARRSRDCARLLRDVERLAARERPGTYRDLLT